MSKKKQERYNLYDARGDRSLRVTKGAADVGRMKSRRQKVRCVNRRQNTGSSRKDHFDLTCRANAKAIVANMWAADPNDLAGLLRWLRKFASLFGEPSFSSQCSVSLLNFMMNKICIHLQRVDFS